MSRQVAAGSVVLLGLVLYGAWLQQGNGKLLTRIEEVSLFRSASTVVQTADVQQANTIKALGREIQIKQSQLTLVKAETLTAPAATGPAPQATVNLQRSYQDSPDYRDAMLRQRVTQQYGVFIYGLKLRPEQDARMKSRMVGVMQKNSALQERVIKGELAAEAAGKEARVLQQEFDAILEEYSSKAQRDTAIPAMMAQSVEGMPEQIAKDLPGLSQAGIASVVKAATKVGTSTLFKLTPVDPRGEGKRITQEIERQLQGAIPDEELAMVQAFFTRQLR